MVDNTTDNSTPSPMSLADLQKQTQVDPSLVTPAPAAETPYAGLNLLNQWAQQIRSQKVAEARSEVVKQAITQYKTGDVKGAFATMGMIHPDEFNKAITDQATSGQIALNKKAGELGAQSAYGSTPAQVQAIKSQGQVDAAGKKLDKPVIRKDDNSPTGFSMITPNGVVPFNGYQAQAGAPQAQAPQAGAAPQKPDNLRPNEVWDPEANKKILLAPNQVKHLDSGIKTFDSDTKEIAKALNEATLGSDIVKKNIPGMGVVEKLRALKSAVGNGRVAVQEVQAMGGKEGVETAINTAISEAQGNGLGPQTQQNMLRLLDAAQKFQLEEYNQKLHMHIQRVAGSTNLPTSVVLSRMAPLMPTSIQQKTQDLAQNGSDEDKAAVEWAHQTLLTKTRQSPEWKKALQILQLHGL